MSCILGIIVILCIHMGTLTKWLCVCHGSSQVPIYLVICVSLHVNIFMDVGVSNRYTTEMQRMLFLFHFTAIFNLEPIKSLYQLYFLNNVNNLLVENHFLDYGLLPKWCHTIPLTKTKEADFHQYLNFSYHVLGCIVSEQIRTELFWTLSPS